MCAKTAGRCAQVPAGQELMEKCRFLQNFRWCPNLKWVDADYESKSLSAIPNFLLISERCLAHTIALGDSQHLCWSLYTILVPSGSFLVRSPSLPVFPTSILCARSASLTSLQGRTRLCGMLDFFYVNWRSL
jgi:hypothetical protein